jgi:excisionase family DNA binding protein
VVDNYLNAAQAADYLNLSVATIRALRQQGKLPIVKHGGKVFFTRAALDEYASARAAKLPQALVGQRFGRLIVVTHVGRNKHGENEYACACDCGGRRRATRYQLTEGHARQCARCAKAVQCRWAHTT